jgi:putative prophage lambdaCh01, repressor protein|nr:MAG TPA: helix-turn-helix domain protein [Caudoviricetes sp.]
MNTGDKLKQLRIDKQLSMDALTDKLNSKFGLNITKSMMSRWENNLSEPSSKFVAAYAKYFNVDLNYLVGLTDDRRPLNLTEDRPKTETPPVVDTSVLTTEELAEFEKVTQTNKLLFFNGIEDDDHDMAVFKNLIIDILLKQRKNKEKE